MEKVVGDQGLALQQHFPYKSSRIWNEKEKADNGAVCVANMFRLYWVKNGQVSPFSLAGKHLRMFSTLT